MIRLFRLVQTDRQNAIERVNYVLMDFATSWETLKESAPVDLKRKSIPVLQKGENIKIIATNVLSKLPGSYVGEALDIANQLIHLRNEVERSSHSGVEISGFPKKKSIDELVKKAKELCINDGGKTK